MKQILFTQEGHSKLQEEQKELQASRPAAVADLKKAREMGDLSENGYYRGAKAKLSSIDHRLRQIEHILKNAVVMGALGSEVVQIGSTVTISDGNVEKVFSLVGEYEADPLAGKISHKSPIGMSLLGKKIDEAIVVSTPKGQKSYTIVKIGF